MLSGGPAYYVEPRPRCTAWEPSRTPRQVVNSFVRWIPPIAGTRAVTIIFTIMWWNYQFGHPLGGIHLGWSLPFSERRLRLGRDRGRFGGASLPIRTRFDEPFSV